LQSRGYKVGILTRSKKGLASVQEFLWNVSEMHIDHAALTWADHIIHLAGENVGQRWTGPVKKRILRSRVDASKLLYEELRGDYDIKSFISASAIGYYGDTRDQEINEKSAKGTGFLADVVQKWENAVEEVKPYVDRLVKLRIGIVLTQDGGALGKMVLPIRLGIGSPLGSGQQWMSWIDLQDLCNMFVYALEKPIKGTYNAVAPEPVTNKVMTRALASHLKRPLWLPNVPEFALKMILGEMSSIALEGSKVSSAAIQQEGFKFEYDTLEKSLKHLF
jgi:uncharacterized protein (TIGR01777 family)